MLPSAERPPQARKPRFRRVRTRRFEVTARDLDIIRAVARHRLLTSEHIAMLLPEASKQNLLRRLQLLFHARYLDRPLVQVADFRASARSTPMVYALGAKGHDLLADEKGLASRRPDWTAKNRSLTPTFYRHTVMVSGITVAFEAACRERGRVKTMVAACQKLQGLQGIFLFTDEASLLAGDALEHEWVNGRGEEVRVGE